MDQVIQGGTFTGNVIYRLSTGALVDPTSPYVDILDPAGNNVSPHTLLTRSDVGVYHVTFIVPINAPLGDWTMRYFGIISGAEVSSQQTFNVFAAGAVSAINRTVNRLRLLIGEKIPLGGTETDTRYTDDELIAVYYANNEDLTKTVAELWLTKAAMFTELVDVMESGTQRSLSQMARAANAQAAVWEKRVVAYDAAWAATYRVPGKAIKLYTRDCLPRWLWEPVTVRG
jgi:hypothetical protein